MKNPIMVCSYYSYCIDLPMALVDFPVEGCPLRLRQVCQGYYVLLNGIDFDGAYRSRVEQSGIFITIVLTRYGAGESQRH